jgi:peptide/nickel transport system permease protein
LSDIERPASTSKETATVATSDSRTAVQHQSRLVELGGRLIREQPLGTVGGIITLLLLLTAIFADWLAPYGMNETS